MNSVWKCDLEVNVGLATADSMQLEAFLDQVAVLSTTAATFVTELIIRNNRLSLKTFQPQPKVSVLLQSPDTFCKVTKMYGISHWRFCLEMINENDSRDWWE